MESGKHAVVTGGAGFIGSHLVERLLRAEHRVTVVDDLSTGRRSNLVAVEDHPDLTFVEADVSRSGWGEALDAPDWMFHLAALADIVPSIENPARYHRSNVDGTLVALETARALGVERFVYAASSSCYGLAERFPTPEDEPVRPMYPYALTKLIGEQMVQHWNRVYGLPTVSLRLFNVYGPRARTTGTYGAVFGVFLAQKLAGQPFTVVGDGTQTRDFTFVTDVASAFVAAAVSDLAGAVLNVGSGATQSINHLVDLLGGPVVHVPKRPGEPDCTFADTTRIRDTLGWTPEVSFEEGVARMLQHIEDWRDAPVWDPPAIEQATRAWFRHLAPQGRAA